MLNLRITDDEGKSTRVPLVRDEITIGRQDGNTVRLTERNVSRRHARLRRHNGDTFFTLEAISARYGLFVNGEAVDSPRALNPNDEVRIGDYRLTIEAPKELAVRAPVVRLQTPPPGPALQPWQMGRLVVLSSHAPGQEFLLAAESMVIGRAFTSEITIADASVSGQHARIDYDTSAKAYTITDLGSSNGVRVNGKAHSVMQLRAGDFIDLGKVKLRYCEPGERWSLEQLMQSETPPEAGRGRALWVLALAAAATLVAGVAYWLLVLSPPPPSNADQSRESSASSPTEDEVAAATSPPRVAAPRDNQESLAACRRDLERGRLDEAMLACQLALTQSPGDQDAQQLSDAVLLEQLAMKGYERALSHLAADECGLALAELDALDTDGTAAARRAVAERFRERAEACAARGDASVAEAQPSNAASETTAPITGNKKKRKSSPQSAASKNSESRTAAPPETAGDAQARHDALRAQGMDLFKKQRYVEASDLLRQALRQKYDVNTHVSLALALEKACRDCEALAEYQKVLPKLSGKKQEKTAAKVEALETSCH